MAVSVEKGATFFFLAINSLRNFSSFDNTIVVPVLQMTMGLLGAE